MHFSLSNDILSISSYLAPSNGTHLMPQTWNQLRAFYTFSKLVDTLSCLLTRHSNMVIITIFDEKNDRLKSGHVPHLAIIIGTSCDFDRAVGTSSLLCNFEKWSVICRISKTS